MNAPDGLIAYLEHIEASRGWEIILDDFNAHLRLDPRFRKVSLSFGIHRSPFCMKIKENRKLWDICLEKKEPLREACLREGKPFKGCCYCGREEYVLPVIVYGAAVATLSVGGFAVDREKSLEKLHHGTEKYGLDGKKMERLLLASSPLPAPTLEEVEELLTVVTEYTALYYEGMDVPGGRPAPQGIGTNRQYILAHAVEFLKQQFRENISCRDAAEFCHISESFINHNFKKYTGESVRSYLNRLRLDEAERLLAGTDRPITTIALDCGFGDPNYFSRQFSRRNGLSPREFRKKQTRKND